MNILFSLIYNPQKGGSGAPYYVNELAKNKEKNNKNGVIFSINKEDKVDKEIDYLTHPIFFKKAPIFDNQPQVKNSIPFKNMNQKNINEYIQRMYSKTEFLIKKYKYNLIHVQHGMFLGYVAALIKKKYKIPYIVTLHNMELLFLNEFPRPDLAMFGMQHADKIIALSESQKNKFQKKYSTDNINKIIKKKRIYSPENIQKINENSIEICPLGINLKNFNLKNKKDIINNISDTFYSKDKIVIFAGRLIKMKGVMDLLEAHNIYSKQNIRTIIIGGGEEEEKIKNFAKNHSNIEFLGYKENKKLTYYYNLASLNGGLFVGPSKSEAVGLVYLEALACGLRVLSSAEKDLKKINYMKKPYAYFSPYNQPQKLAQKIIEILNKPKIERKDIRKQVLNYNIQNMIDQVYKIYETVL